MQDDNLEPAENVSSGIHGIALNIYIYLVEYKTETELHQK